MDMSVNTEIAPVGGGEAVHDHDPIRRFEMVELPVGDYVKLAQIRGERNPVTSELRESIMASGLLYPPISAHVSEELMREYIDFVNNLWGSKTSVEDIAERRQEDGMYYLIVAGHSRHQAFEELVDEGRLPADQMLPTKVTKIASVWDIIELQRADNIHSAPPKERNAMATIEAYEWGRQKGEWKNMTEFVVRSKENSKAVSASVLKEMKHFTKLPGEIRTFVLGGSIPYSVGIEMGRSVDEVRRYYALEAGYSSYDIEIMTPEHRGEVDSFVSLALNVDCIRIVEAKTSSTFTIMAAKALVKATAQTYRQRADRIDIKVGAVEEPLFALEDSSGHLLEERRRAVARDMRRLVRTHDGTAEAFVKQHLGGNLGPEEVGALARLLERQAAEAGKIRDLAQARQRDMGGTGLALVELAG